MSDATTTDGEPSADRAADRASDPTLAALVPRRSPARNALLAAAAVIVLVLAWLSPNVLRPSLVNPREGGGTWAVLEDRGQVLAVMDIDPRGWPSVVVESVGEVPRARVARAWVVGSDWSDNVGGPDPVLSRYHDTVDYVQALFPKDDLDAGRLPVRLEPGSEGRLVVLWEITDCALLDERAQPEVALRSVLGTTTHEQLDSALVGPAAYVDTLVEFGICPAGSVPGGF